MVLVNLCSMVDGSFKEILDDANFLTDFAVEIRYPDDWYEPSLDEVQKAYNIALKIKNYVINKIDNNK